MTEKIEPIFTAELDNPNDMELLKEFFGREALDRVFENGGDILENATIARQIQKLEASAPPEIRAINERMHLAIEKEAAIKRQTRKPEEPKTAVQMDLF